MFFYGAQTVLETSDTQRFGRTLHCEGYDPNNTGSPISCTPGTGLIVHKRVEADELDMVSRFYDYSVLVDIDGSSPIQDAVEYMDADTRVRGVCSEGTGDDGSNSIFTKTRDGDYSSNDTICE